MSASVVNDVRKHLENLNSLSEARRLFSDLNYDPVNLQPLDRSKWSDPVREHLANDPSIIARSGDFYVIYNRLNSDKLERGKERDVVTRLTREYPFALYVFSDKDESDWRFINVKHEDEPGRRRVLRRFTVGEDERAAERLRTVSEQLSHISIADNEIGRLTPLELQSRQDRAFDVEAVTKNFYQKYHDVFDLVEKSLKGFGQEADKKRLFTQRLFNRLMFIAFVQKKGWLQFPNQQGTDYLSALWVDYTRKRSNGEESNFYNDRLKILFFSGLNAPHTGGDGVTSIKDGGFIETVIGKVPYLNGGLFEEDEDDKRSDITIPDDGVHAILSQIFDRFNFTIDESTPLDIEVAVDPEMLGKVFEELVTGRHETGSYYTPKPIVSFMCHEALKGYLGTKLPHESTDAIARFVDEYDAAGIHNPEAILDALRNLTACDPACGSGAYLLGLLQELIELRSALFRVAEIDAPTTYHRKLEIIEKNLYGVDIDPFAVNIARLRLWLSLAVDFTGEKPEPLPNLDFKIEVGDSILGPSPATSRRDPTYGTLSDESARSALIREYVELKSQYLRAHYGMKRSLLQQIAEKRQQIAIWTHGGAPVNGFDWEVEFAETIARGGFNIVLANPPYVRVHRLSKEVKEMLWKQFAVFKAKADLYSCFIQRGIELLCPSGIICFICSDGWQRLDSYDELRDYILNATEPRELVDLRYDVFEQASVKVSIFLFSKVASKESSPDGLGFVRFGAAYSNEDVESLGMTEIPISAFRSAYKQIFDTSWTEASYHLAKQIRESGQPLGQLLTVDFGLKTGDDERFISTIQISEYSKPLLRGENISRYAVNWAGEYVDYRPEMMKAHRSTARPGDRERFECRKVLVRDTGNGLQCALDEQGFYVKDVLIVRSLNVDIDIGYVAGVLNSSTMKWFYERSFPTLHVQAGELRSLPIVHPIQNPELSNRLAKLARTRQGCPDPTEARTLDREMDDIVRTIYGVVSRDAVDAIGSSQE